ncbi:hypothetical protein AMS68_002387 [Peltaster fructicola]|uniref:Uncharacterized protein n=1 Tax=Peltaster fructicola TaxID=286661 RepID=A0A6H0XQX6_9PEZI|nr:hypothetical protein AMS68_002387 [Peltaster fructicola]
MAPSVLLDTSSDFDFNAVHSKSPNASKRTLIIAPPSVSAHPETLNGVLEAHDRSSTDIQMLDRLAMGLVSLPAATYDVVMLLTDVDGSAAEVDQLLDRTTMDKIFQSLDNNGRLVSRNGRMEGTLKTEAVLAGMQDGGNGTMLKQSSGNAAQTVQLSFGKRKKADAAAVPANPVEATIVGKRKAEESVVQLAPNGVGFVDTNDDYEDDEMEMEIPSNEELMQADSVDPDTFLSASDLEKPIIVPENCKPNSKRRRACKDCTCGLAQRLEAEDKVKRAEADSNLAKLTANDLTEVDFTVQGKIGSCGNCALGDAFRCDGCPYIGLPAFKPGEEVRLLDNEVQL